MKLDPPHESVLTLALGLPLDLLGFAACPTRAPPRLACSPTYMGSTANISYSYLIVLSWPTCVGLFGHKVNGSDFYNNVIVDFAIYRLGVFKIFCIYISWPKNGNFQLLCVRKWWSSVTHFLIFDECPENTGQTGWYALWSIFKNHKGDKKVDPR